MNLDWISLLIGIFAGALLAGAFLWPRLAVLKEKLANLGEADEAMKNAFAMTAQEALRQSNEQFLQLAQERLKQAHTEGSHDLEKRQKAIDEMVKPVRDHLEKLHGAVEQIKGTDKAMREDLQNLHRETAKLAGALRDPAARGKWGEFILERLLDKSGLIKGVHYESQVTMQTGDGTQRPDVVIHLQDGFNIVVDAKAPVNEFIDRLHEDLSEDQHKELMVKLARQVRDHVRKLGSKGYWEKLDSPDFVVMFLPSEQLFSTALRADPDLVDFAAEHSIVVASPTLMISLLRVVGLSWRQVELAKNAQDISSLGTELYKRISTFGGHMEKLGRGLAGAMDGYNAAVGSLERSVLPQARKFKDLQVQTGGKDLPELSGLEHVPKSLTAAELTSDNSAPSDIIEEKEDEAA